MSLRRSAQSQSKHDERGDRDELQNHKDILRRAARAYTKAIDDCEYEERDRGERCGSSVAGLGADDGQEIFRERDRDRGHSTTLDNEQQRPAINKAESSMKRVAQVNVLPTTALTLRTTFAS